MHIAQRLRDSADEELVALLGTFETATHREPDLAEELDRTDEAAEAEVDEGTPSLAQQRQLLRAHVNLGHPTIREFCRALRNGRCRGGVVRWTKRHFQCPECDQCRELGRRKLCRSVPVATRFATLTRWKYGIRWTEKTLSEYRTSSVTGHVTTREHEGRT